MKIIARALAALLLALGLVVVSAAPASAGYEHCNTAAEDVCVWTDLLASGEPDYYWTVSAGSGGYCVNLGGGLNDQVRNIKITGGRSATIYWHAGCGGSAIAFVGMPPSGPQTLNCDQFAWATDCISPQSSSIWIVR